MRWSNNFSMTKCYGYLSKYLTFLNLNSIDMDRRTDRQNDTEMHAHIHMHACMYVHTPRCTEHTHIYTLTYAEY